MDLLNGKVRVYNYQQSPVGFPSTVIKSGVFIEARDEDQEYKIERVLWEDIELENNKSDIFKVGRLRFHPDEEDEIYLKLGIEDRENIKNDKELMQVLLDDSIENLKKLNNIKSLNLLTRMKRMLFNMERVNKIPPHNVISVVTERYEELKSGGKKNPESIVSRIMEQDKKLRDENKLKETLQELTQKVEKLEKEKSKTEEQSTKALTDLLEMVNQLKKENEQLKGVVESKVNEEKQPVVTKNESKNKQK